MSGQMEIAALTTLSDYLKKMEMISLYDYQRMIFDSLATPMGNTNSYGKHLWIKKATGLGISDKSKDNEKMESSDSNNKEESNEPDYDEEEDQLEEEQEEEAGEITTTNQVF
jgi:hypothetical protein